LSTPIALLAQPPFSHFDTTVRIFIVAQTEMPMLVTNDLLHARSATLSARAAAAIGERIGKEPIDIGLVLGTGLGSLAEAVEDAVAIPYGEVPHFPKGGVSGHAGRLVVGRIGGKRVVVLQGRVHFYEQGDAEAMRVPLEALAILGATSILLTNSAGSLVPDLAPPSIVALRDHISLQGRNPLIGDVSDARFVNMVDAYDPALRASLRSAASACGSELSEGVYAWFSGPSFETPAEIRAARILGADLVGMSTVPEVIMARRLGLRVAALALVTNFGAGMKEGEPISHEQTKAVALEGAGRMKALVLRFLAETSP
jgi:purine-nucleoside phosphorylase